VGGVASDGSFKNLTRAEIYDPATGVFTQTGSMAMGREDDTATLLADGRVLVAGGDGGTKGKPPVNDAEVYDPATGAFQATGSMLSPRGSYSATLLDSGKVLLAGGFDGESRSLSSAEIYDPGTGTWSLTGSLISAQYLQTATLLSDGRVLLAGGNGTPGAPAQIYDPVTGKFGPAS